MLPTLMDENDMDENDDTSTDRLAQPPADDPRPSGMRTVTSLVLVNTGDGKGKSSAAFGVMLRALSRDWKVAVVQFIKSGDWKMGEEKMGRQLGVDWHALGAGFTWDSDNIDHDIALAQQAWAQAAAIIAAGEHRLVILDELTYLCNWGWLAVVTGRDAPQAIIDIADTVTEMKSVKHAYEAGITAKKGIDY